MSNSTHAVPAINPSEIRIVDGRPTTTSLHVAEHFGKLHKNVLKAIGALDCTPEFHKLNFEPMITKVTVGKGAVREEPAYRMTRDGFTFLCMGFTGKEAAKWKEAYINAFNQMEQQLQQQTHHIPLLVPADEDTILLHYNRRPLLVYRHGQHFWYRAAHIAALVGMRDSHGITRSLPPEDVSNMQNGNHKTSMISHRAMLASLGRLKREEAEALLAWLQQVIPGAFIATHNAPPAITADDAGSLLRGMLADTRFLCYLDDMGRVNLREIPNSHLIIDQDRVPAWIADPQGPTPKALASILQAVSHRMGQRA